LSFRSFIAISATVILASIFAPSVGQTSDASAKELTGMTTGHSSLVVAYSFDEGEGNEARDESGGGHTGEIGGATWGEPERGGGHSLHFDGEEGCLTVHESGGIDLQHGFTVDAWVRPETSWVSEAGEEKTIFEVPASESSPAVALRIDGSPETLQAVIGEESAGQFSIVSDLEEANWGRWQYVAMTFDGTDLRLYLGGELIGQAAVESPAVGSGPMTVGCSRTTPNTFLGSIDELRVYTRALSAEELSEDETSLLQPVHLEVYGQLPNVPEGGFDSIHSGLYVRAVGEGEGGIEQIKISVDGTPTSLTSRKEALENGGSEYCSGAVCYLGYEYRPEQIWPSGVTSGKHTVSVVVKGDGGQEATFEKATLLDVDPPTIHLTGQLAEDAGLMTDESENLIVSATDGKGAGASGLEYVSLHVNGEGGFVKSPSCEGGCGGDLEASYTYSLEEWGGNPRELTVEAVDASGNMTRKTLTVEQAVHPDCGSVKCTDIWTGPKKGDWGTAKWWSAEHVPTSSDVVYIEAGKTVEDNEESAAASVFGEGSLAVSTRGSLTLSDPSETSKLGHLEITKGSLTDNGSLTITGSLALTEEGGLSDTGVTRLASGATGVGESASFERGSFVNEGTMNFDGDILEQFRFREGAGFRNEGTVKSGEYSRVSLSEGSEIRNSALWEGGGSSLIKPEAETPAGTASFVNEGTLRAVVPVDEVGFDVPFDNTGVIEARTGIVQFNHTTVVSTGGALSSEGGGLIRSYGSEIEVVGGTITGKLSQWGGRERLAGELGASNLTLWAYGPTEFLEENIGSATLEFDPIDLPLRNLEVDEDVTITGSADVSVSEGLYLSGEDALVGSGKIVCEAEGQGWIEGADELEQTFVNEGTIRLDQGSLDLKGEAALENIGTFIANSEEEEGIKSSAAPLAQEFALSEGGSQSANADPGQVLGEVESVRPSVGGARAAEDLSGRNPARAPSFRPVGGHPVPAMTYEGGGTKFVNDGTVKKTAGPGTTTLAVPFTNNGTIKEASGHLNISRPRHLAYSAATPHQFSCADPVDCSTGNFTEAQTDLEIGGRGVGLELTRTYSAQSAAAEVLGIFGYGWTNSFGDQMTSEEGGAKELLTEASGGTIPFTKSGISWSVPGWSRDKLTGSTEAGFTLILPDQTTEKFSGAGRLESMTDRDGNETTLAYNGAGELETITDPSGRTITLSYNTEGLVDKASDPTGDIVKYTYESGNLKSVTLPGEASPNWQFEYDSSHRMISMTDGRGGETTNEYDGSNRVISQTDPGGRTFTWSYESFHTTITNEATGAVTDEWFNSDNQPYSVTDAYGTASATTETFTYTAGGQLASTTDGDGHTTTYGYDPGGDRTSERNPEGDEMRWTYDEAHELTSETTPSGEKTTIVRNANGNPETVSRPAPESKTQTVSYQYGPHGEVESMTNPLGATWTYGYDKYGDRISETDPEGDERTWAYNEDSRMISTVSPRGNESGAEPAEFTTTVESDARGRPVKITDPRGGTTEYAYDADGNIESITNPDGYETKFTYDADDDLTKVERPNGDVEETGYDGAGQVVSQTNGDKDKTTYVRNILEQPVKTIDPLERKTTRTFDAAGNLVAKADPDGRTTIYGYDKADRLKEISYSAEPGQDVALGYDEDGDLTSMKDATGESTLEYDQLGRLIRSKDGNGESVAWTYNIAGEPVGLTYPNGKSISRAYDKAGRLESVTDWLGHTTTFAYDRDSEPTATTFPTSTGDKDEYTYDRDDRMSGVSFKKGTESLAALAYMRERDGRVESSTDEGLPGAAAEAFSYDEDGRLTTAGSSTFGYDPANNITEAPGTTNSYDKASQIKSTTAAAFTFNKDGERTKETPSSGPATIYGYDQAGNLTAIERTEEGGTPAIGESFGYYGSGLLASRTVGLTTTHFVWDLGESPEQLLSDGANSYVYGPGGLPLEQISSAEVPTYIHHDKLGSTRLLTNAEGKAAATFTYAPYGSLSASTGTSTTPLGYAGQYTLEQSGLQYLRARFYDPATGQLLTRDPLEDVTDQPYAYADDEPIDNEDPSGLFSIGEVIEGAPSIPCPWCSAEHAVTELMEGAWGHAEWLWNEAGENIHEPAKQGAAAARAGCEILERTNPDGKVHGSIPSHPDPNWTEEELEEVAEDLRESIPIRREELEEFGEEPKHRRQLQEEERLLGQIERTLSGK
jgi:RHS repeat-associated protein